jgi:hypothetical protein
MIKDKPAVKKKKIVKTKPKAPKRKIGRPKSRTDEQIKVIQNEICTRIATTSKSLRQICQDMIKDFDHMPCYRDIVQMLADDKEFSPQYARAKAIQAELLFDEILEISDDSSLDMACTEEGKPFIDHEHVNRSRLRVDSRKFYIAKILPKKYSEKHEVTGKDGGPVEFLFKVIYDDAPKGNSEE